MWFFFSFITDKIHQAQKERQKIILIILYYFNKFKNWMKTFTIKNNKLYVYEKMQQCINFNQDILWGFIYLSFLLVLKLSGFLLKTSDVVRSVSKNILFCCC